MKDRPPSTSPAARVAAAMGRGNLPRGGAITEMTVRHEPDCHAIRARPRRVPCSCNFRVLVELPGGQVLEVGELGDVMAARS